MGLPQTGGMIRGLATSRKPHVCEAAKHLTREGGAGRLRTAVARELSWRDFPFDYGEDPGGG
jgi:hypothetical protein